MRITGGIYSNRRIRCPKQDIRPAMDRMRESLFAVLGDLTGCSFLDLFSGSGIIGLEAASRGASPISFVEKDGRKRAYLKENTSFLNTEFRIVIMPVERYLQRFNEQFDIVFLDPPFRYRNKESLIAMVLHRNICREEGKILLHHPKEDLLPEKIEGFARYDERTYGRSVVSFYNISGL